MIDELTIGNAIVSRSFEEKSMQKAVLEAEQVKGAFMSLILNNKEADYLLVALLVMY